MSEALFDTLCEEFRPYLTKQTTKFRKPVPVETQVAVTLYYLAGEDRIRKVPKSFGLGKATVSKAIRRVTSVISEKLGLNYYVCRKRKKMLKSIPETFTKDTVSLNALVLLTVHIKFKRPVDNPTDYVGRKGNFTLNCQETVAYNY